MQTAVAKGVVRFLFRHRRLDQVFEGKPEVLIDKGRVSRKALAKELLTHSELITVLHRQGFDKIEDVERCVLEPGGTFYIQRKLPPADEVAHAEVMKRLDELARKMEMLLQQKAG